MWMVITCCHDKARSQSKHCTVNIEQCTKLENATGYPLFCDFRIQGLSRTVHRLLKDLSRTTMHILKKNSSKLLVYMQPLFYTEQISYL